jgi:hypothetical protein
MLKWYVLGSLIWSCLYVCTSKFDVIHQRDLTMTTLLLLSLFCSTCLQCCVHNWLCPDWLPSAPSCWVSSASLLWLEMGSIFSVPMYLVILLLNNSTDASKMDGARIVSYNVYKETNTSASELCWIPTTLPFSNGL